MTIQIDSREKSRAIKKIIADFDKKNIQHFVSKLPCGDYMSLDNARLAVDRKQNLFEVCNNVCQDHKRFVAELERANELGIRLVFLIEHGPNIRCLSDVKKWVNPRLEKSPLAVSGERLYKILSVIETTYNTKFYFCAKHQTGRGIIKLLGGGVSE